MSVVKCCQQTFHVSSSSNLVVVVYSSSSSNCSSLLLLCMLLTVLMSLVEGGDGVDCYSCVSSNYERGNDVCLEDSFDKDEVALLQDCDCCRVCIYTQTRGATRVRKMGDHPLFSPPIPLFIPLPLLHFPPFSLPLLISLFLYPCGSGTLCGFDILAHLTRLV